MSARTQAARELAAKVQVATEVGWPTGLDRALGKEPHPSVALAGAVRMLASAVLELADDCESTMRVLDSRTEHLV